MPFTYVIPDLHGRADLLDVALRRIADHAAGRAATLVLLGDYVSKGPDSRGVIARLLTLSIAGWRIVALKGNHDAMMVEALRDPSRMAAWLQRGGNTTLASYGGDASAIPAAHVAWLDARPLLYEDVHRIYVHAGLDPGVPLKAQSEKVLLWKRYAKGESGAFAGRHVVHGHDNAPDGPLLFKGRSNLDACAWRTGRLVVGIFDDAAPGGPIDFIVATARRRRFWELCCPKSWIAWFRSPRRSNR